MTNFSSTQYTAQLTQSLIQGFWKGIWIAVELFAGIIWAAFLQHPFLFIALVLLGSVIILLRLKGVKI